MSKLVDCACGARIDVVEAWFHPGTGAVVCDRCHAAAERERARQALAAWGDVR